MTKGCVYKTPRLVTDGVSIIEWKEQIAYSANLVFGLHTVNAPFNISETSVRLKRNVGGSREKKQLLLANVIRKKKKLSDTLIRAEAIGKSKLLLVQQCQALMIFFVYRPVLFVRSQLLSSKRKEK